MFRINTSPDMRKHPTGCKSKRVHAVAKVKGLGLGLEIRLGTRDNAKGLELLGIRLGLLLGRGRGRHHYPKARFTIRR